MPPKTVTSSNWVPSIVTEGTLKDFAKIDFLLPKDILHWRAPKPNEERPHPKDGEVILFTDHMNRGFSPPGSKFFRDVLHFFQLHPQDIGPNSVSNICNFQVFCEVYLQEEPSVELFREYFYLNRQNEFTNRPSLGLGGISIQQRRDAIFPYACLPSHPKDWNQTWFYCKDTSPADENPLPGYREQRLNSNYRLPEKLTAAERAKLAPTISKVKALLGNGLTSIDLVRCWISWRIIPLSRRPGLMCTYTGSVKDPLRYSSTPLPDETINEMTKVLLNEELENYSKEGLNPFCKLNLPPYVSA